MGKLVTPIGDFNCQSFPINHDFSYNISDEELTKLANHELKWSQEEYEAEIPVYEEQECFRDVEVDVPVYEEQPVLVGYEKKQLPRWVVQEDGTMVIDGVVDVDDLTRPIYETQSVITGYEKQTIQESYYADVQVGTEKVIKVRPILIENDNEREQRLKYVTHRINELKKLLKDTDYQAIKYAEGLISENDYQPIKALRQSYRDEINMLEEEL